MTVLGVEARLGAPFGGKTGAVLTSHLPGHRGCSPLMHALITDDDGVDSAGLRTLVQAAVGCGLEVTAAAPAVRSARNPTSCSRLRAAYPRARLVYLGLPWHAQLLRGRSGPGTRPTSSPPGRASRAARTATSRPAPAAQGVRSAAPGCGLEIAGLVGASLVGLVPSLSVMPSDRRVAVDVTAAPRRAPGR